MFGASRSQLSTLLVVTGGLATGPPVVMLLDSQIPHKPGAATMPGQRSRLRTGGEQPRSAHTGNIGGSRKETCAVFLPRLNPGVCTPQNDGCGHDHPRRAAVAWADCTVHRP